MYIAQNEQFRTITTIAERNKCANKVNTILQSAMKKKKNFEEI